MPEILNSCLFGFWNDLGSALKTGKPQNEIKHNGKPMLEELYSDGTCLGEFLNAMTGFQAANFQQLAEAFGFSKYKSVGDVGGALAPLSRTLGAHHQHLTFSSFDFSEVAPDAFIALALISHLPSCNVRYERFIGCDWCSL